MFESYVPFTNCISRINNIHIEGAHDIDVVMPMHNLIEYSDNYSKTSGILWQYCRDEPALATNGDITDFNTFNADTKTFKIKEKITVQTGINGTKNFETMVALKYLSNIWRTLQMPLINCKINLDLKWSKNCVILAAKVVAQTQHFQ